MKVNSEHKLKNSKKRFLEKGYKESQTEKFLAEVNFERSAALKKKLKYKKKILPFVTEFNPAKPNLKLLFKNCCLIENQLHLNTILPQKIYRTNVHSSSFKDMLVK